MMLKKFRKFINYITRINIINKKTEKVLFILSITFIILLIISQVGLINEDTRTFFTSMDKYEGINLNDIDGVVNEGKLSLKLIGINPDKNIKVLINGTPEYEFNDEIIHIKVKNNSLIEIDGTKSKFPFKVEIIEYSTNIIENNNISTLEVNSNIEVLTKVFLK